jgi:hypothetical protein
VASIFVVAVVEELVAFVEFEELAALGVPESLGALASVGELAALGKLLDDSPEVLSLPLHAAKSDINPQAIRVLTRAFTKLSTFCRQMFEMYMPQMKLL